MKQKEAAHYFLVQTEELQFGVIAKNYEAARGVANGTIKNFYKEENTIIQSICMIPMFWSEEGLKA